MYRATTDAFARAYWHWFFLIQPAPFPEQMIGADPDAYWRAKCGERGFDLFDPRALDAYLEAFRDPAAIAAFCEDYRAAAMIDIRHDDVDQGRRLTQPLLVLWGEFGVVERCFDCVAL
jgi:haloacetate dehalogenase